MEYGKVGALRTLFMILLPMFATLLDSMLGMPGLFFYAITMGLIYRTWQSITANAFRAAWGKWIPKSVIQQIEGELKVRVEHTAMRDVSEESNNETSLRRK